MGLAFSAPVHIKNGIYHIQGCKCKDVFFFDAVNGFSNLDVINAMLDFTNSMSDPAKRNITLIIINQIPTTCALHFFHYYQNKKMN